MKLKLLTPMATRLAAISTGWSPGKRPMSNRIRNRISLTCGLWVLYSLVSTANMDAVDHALVPAFKAWNQAARQLGVPKLLIR